MVAAVWSGLVTIAIAFVIKKIFGTSSYQPHLILTQGRLKLSKAEELLGLDAVEHEESAYHFELGRDPSFAFQWKNIMFRRCRPSPSIGGISRASHRRQRQRQLGFVGIAASIQTTIRVTKDFDRYTKWNGLLCEAAIWSLSF